jgi:NAD(P)-dependent dehydrogenase (short-subunit alcohol dehydrogenase family)
MNILITGTGRGIGYHTALALSAQADTRVFALSRNTDKLRKLCEVAAYTHPLANIIPVLFDLEKGDLGEVVAQIRKYEGGIDILINNAASILVKPFMEQTEEEFARIYQLNVIRTAALIRSIVPLMGQTKPAHIVNISSMGGFQGSMKFAGLSAYSSSKAALAGLTECLAEEFKEKGIAVNCLCLGAVQTEMLQEAFPGYEAPVKPEQMATYIADFALNGAKYYNGKILPVSLSTP